MKNKSIITVLILIISILSLKAQKVEIRQISPFNKVQISGNFNVELVKGNSGEVKIISEDINPTEIVTELSDNTLKVKMNSKLDVFKDIDVDIFITYKELKSITANASADIVIKDTITSNNFHAKATSAADIELITKIENIELTVLQGAQIIISGDVNKQESYVNTGGILSATNLQCNEVFIKINTGGKAEVVANELIDASVNTGADLSYYGKPKQEKIKNNLGGTISKWDE
ncbi:MAG: head GIN domain-containing protein [Bacteroidota bacterium]|nr:head GIN domain-containing protein [Bacteroidota bacterium]